FYFPKKAFTPSHDVLFPLISIGFECEGLGFQSIHTVPEAFTLTSEAFTLTSEAFTPAVNTCEGLKEQAFTPENRLIIRR
ncbi:MAG: hypothetical protein PUE17_01745, partial [Bacteroidales bacterium]|nr:hypothetical protein [Bacteroidales bacterium]